MRRRSFLAGVSAAPLLRTSDKVEPIIDVHAHCILIEHDQFMRKLGSSLVPRTLSPRSLPSSDEPQHLAARIKMMDAAGVATQILSPPPTPYLADRAQAVAQARLINDNHARLMRAHPGRLAAYVSLPLPHIDDSLAEMKRGLDELGMAGVTLLTAVGDRSIADEQFDRIYAEMDRRGVTLFFHPCARGMGSPMLVDYGLISSVGPTLEDTALAAQLITKRIPSRFPNVRIIIPHLGGLAPMLAQRLDNQLATENPGLPEKPSVTLRRFWYDTVCHGSAPTLRCVCELMGADRVLAGSDYPALAAFEPYNASFDFVRRSGLPEGDVQAILHRNVHAAFPRGFGATPAVA